MRFKVQYSAVKNYFLGFITSVAFLGAGLYFLNGNEAEPPSITFNENAGAENSSSPKIKLAEFNPNDLNEKEWKDLGFSERQVATILKYKSVVGGNFTSKEQFKKCYAISETKYGELEPYILLPNKKEYASSGSNYQPRNFANKGSYNPSNYKAKGLNIPGKFNPDYYSATDFENLGFSEKQASAIMKYKSFLGGSFISKEKFKECYIINEENYRKLAPYLLLPEKTPPAFSEKRSFTSEKPSNEKAKINYQPFDPNNTDLEGWKNLGFSEKQAHVIINYRDRNLRGSFKSLDDIEKCFVISAEKFAELKPFIILNNETIKPKISDKSTSNSSNSNVSFATNSAKNSEDITDFRKTDLNEISFKQLIEFGFDEKGAASFIGFRKKLGGFVTTDQIVDTYNLDKNLAQKLVATSPLLVDNVAKYSLLDAPESWLKNHPYFKYYADKIIYYRITYSNEKKFYKSMNITPEAEKKMKLYLK